MIDILIAFALGVIIGIIALSIYCSVAIKNKNKKD